MQSEFASLSDLAMKRGITHSDLISRVHQSVLNEFRERYPKSPMGISVMVDETTGTVRIFSADRDITPKDFAADGARIARQTLIELLSAPGAEHAITVPRQTETTLRIWPVLIKILFWGYNIYLMFILGIVTLMIITSNSSGFSRLIQDAGVFKVLLYTILVITPPFSVYYVLRSGIHRNAEILSRYLFLLEMPMIVLLAVPILFFGTLTGTVWFFTLLLIFLPVAFFTFDSHTVEADSPWMVWLLGFVQSIVMTVTYLTGLFTFIVPPVLVMSARGLFGNIFVQFGSRYSGYSGDIGEMILVLTVGSIVYLLITGLLCIPFMVLTLVWRNLLSLHELAVRQLPPKKVSGIHVFVCILWFMITGIVSYQGYGNALLEKLDTFSRTPVFEEKETIVKSLSGKEQVLKQAIGDIGNFRGKYLFSRDDHVMKDLYRESFSSMDEQTAEFIDSMFTVAAYPFIYAGPTDSGGKLSAAFYNVFGYSPYGYEQDISDQNRMKNVRLAGRTVAATVDKVAPIATVTVTEQYDNTTYTNQEVIYEFSLPEESVVTGLKLGPNLEFTGQIAPKGAAAATYQQEVNRRRDPALLEKTGPRQYRLRVFPVPGRNDGSLGGKYQQVQFTYMVPLLPGGLAIPEYYKSTNILIDKGSVITFTVDGQQAVVSIDSGYILYPVGDICKTGAVGSVKIGDATVRMEYQCRLSAPISLTGSTIGIFLDVSRKNAASPAIKDLQNYFTAHPEILRNNTVTLYRFNTALSKGMKLTPDNLTTAFAPVFFGTSDLTGAVNGANKPSGFDTAIIVTNSEQSVLSSKDFPYTFSGPVYAVHPGAIPPYSAKFTYGIVKSRGKTVHTIDEALAQYALYRQTVTNPNILSAGLFMTIQADRPMNALPGQSWPDISKDENRPMSVFATQGYLSYRIAQAGYDISSNLSFLDNAHVFAKTAGIVTQYSSLIALVNDTQQQNLDRLSQTYDRYADQSQSVTFQNPRPVPISGGGRILNPSIEFKSSPSINSFGGGGGGMMGALGTPAMMDGGGSGVGSLFSSLPGLTFLGVAVISGIGFIFSLFSLLRKPRK